MSRLLLDVVVSWLTREERWANGFSEEGAPLGGWWDLKGEEGRRKGKGKGKRSAKRKKKKGRRILVGVCQIEGGDRVVASK